MGQKNCRYQVLRVCLAGWLAICPSIVTAAGEGPIGLVLEPSFAAPEIRHEVEGARSTVLVPGRVTSAGVDTFTTAEWSGEGLAWPEVMAGAMEIADALVETMEVTWERDRNGVIVFGEVRSKDPFLGSVLFSKQFLGRFRNELGASVHAVMPEQGRIFVFPRHGGKLEDFGAALVQRYRESAFKVSLEVFLVDGEGCRVVGSLGADSRI